MKQITWVFVALCVAVSAFAQGFYTQSKMEGGMMGERTSEMFAMPKKLKTVEQLSSAGAGAAATQGTIMIIRLDKEVMWTLDPAKKTYSEMTFAGIDGMTNKAGGKMDAATEKMERELASMPEEQRKMVRQMMGNKMPGSQTDAVPVQVVNAGERKTISGFACTKYLAKRGDEVILTAWTTRDVRGFTEMRKDWEEFSRRRAAMMPRFGKEMAEAFSQIEGFPIQTVATMMNNTVTTTVTKVERRSTPASEFEIPAGYTKVKSELDDAMEKMDND